MLAQPLARQLTAPQQYAASSSRSGAPLPAMVWGGEREDHWSLGVLSVTEEMNRKIEALDRLVEQAKGLHGDERRQAEGSIKAKRLELVALDDTLCRLLESQSAMESAAVQRRPSKSIESNYQPPLSVSTTTIINGRSASLAGQIDGIDSRVCPSGSETGSDTLEPPLDTNKMKRQPSRMYGSADSLEEKPVLLTLNNSQMMQALVEDCQRRGHERALNVQVIERTQIDGNPELTIKQASAVVKTWNEARKPQTGERFPLGVIATVFFDHFFTRRPDMKSLFSDINFQAEFFAGFVDLIVPSPEKEHTARTFRLVEQSQQHAHLGFTQDFYESAYEALTDTVKERIGDKFDTRSKEAWYASCRLVTSSLLAAQAFFQRPKPQKSTGLSGALRKLKKFGTKDLVMGSGNMSTVSMAPVDVNGLVSQVRRKGESVMPELTLKQAAFISKAWREACEPIKPQRGENREMPLAAINQSFYEDFFARCPEARLVFGTNFMLQTDFFSCIVTHIVPSACDLNFKRDVMEMGEQHARLGITREMYKSACEALTYVVKSRIGDKFDTRLRDAWLTSCNLVIESMIAAQRLSAKKRNSSSNLQDFTAHARAVSEIPRSLLVSKRSSTHSSQSAPAATGHGSTGSSGPLHVSGSSFKNVSKSILSASTSPPNLSGTSLFGRTPSTRSANSEPMADVQTMQQLDAKRRHTTGDISSRMGVQRQNSLTVPESLPFTSQPPRRHTHGAMSPSPLNPSSVLSTAMRDSSQPQASFATDGDVMVDGADNLCPLPPFHPSKSRSRTESQGSYSSQSGGTNSRRSSVVSMGTAPPNPSPRPLEVTPIQRTASSLPILGSKRSAALAKAWKRMLDPDDGTGVRSIEQIAVMFYSVLFGRWPEARLYLSNSPLQGKFFISLVSNFIPGQPPRDILDTGDADITRTLYDEGCEALTTLMPSLVSKKWNEQARQAAAISKLSLMKFLGGEPMPTGEPGFSCVRSGSIIRENSEMIASQAVSLKFNFAGDEMKEPPLLTPEMASELVRGWRLATEGYPLDVIRGQFFEELHRTCPECSALFPLDQPHGADTEFFVAFMSTLIPGHRDRYDLYLIGRANGVLAYMYRGACDAMQSLLQKRLGDRWDGSLACAWEAAVNELCAEMAERERLKYRTGGVMNPESTIDILNREQSVDPWGTSESTIGDSSKTSSGISNGTGTTSSSILSEAAAYQTQEPEFSVARQDSEPIAADKPIPAEISEEDAWVVSDAWQAVLQPRNDTETFPQGIALNIFWAVFFEKLPESRPLFHTVQSRRDFFNLVISHIVPGMEDAPPIRRKLPRGATRKMFEVSVEGVTAVLEDRLGDLVDDILTDAWSNNVDYLLG